MPLLLRYIRHIVLTATIVTILAVYIFWTRYLPQGSLQTIRITETYALLAVTFLYLTLLPGALYSAFRSLPFASLYFRARRALGVSVFLYAFIHTCFAFFGLLGGFPGLSFLSTTYVTAITFSFIALIILSLLAATSFDWMVVKLGGKRWKILHRFVYLAGILILIHALLLGSQFSNLSSWIPEIFFAAFAVLIILESFRIDKYLHTKLHMPKSFGITFVIAMCLVSIAAFQFFVPSSNIQSFNIHAQHQLLAQQALQASQTTSNNPALVGDKTLRYTVSFNNSQNIIPGQDTQLTFSIYNASNGNPVVLFTPVYAKTMHLIIVNQDLTYFAHIHPVQVDNQFIITTQFPQNDLYHIYIDFQPIGAIEQQFAFTVKVGNSPSSLPDQKTDTKQPKPFGNYEVTMKTNQPLQATRMSLGNQIITFTVKDAQTKQPITTLKPYLAAFGHLTMINEKTYDYIHVHPSNIIAPPPNANAGPNVDFIPIGIYGPFKPGIYKAFAEFNPNGNLFTAEFTVNVN